MDRCFGDLLCSKRKTISFAFLLLLLGTWSFLGIHQVAEIRAAFQQVVSPSSSKHYRYDEHNSTQQVPVSDDKNESNNDGLPMDDALVGNDQRQSVINATTPSTLVIHERDYIYNKYEWTSSPVVLEEYRLIFFLVPKVGCTTFSMLFRRWMGLSDWEKVGGKRQLPYHPNYNGLRYLSDYKNNSALVHRMMTSPEWTRAIFVRDPVARCVSAYLDKAVVREEGKKTYFQRHCGGEAAKRNISSLKDFVAALPHCSYDQHWRPQFYRMEAKYWPFVTFIGHMERWEDDMTVLMKRVNVPSSLWRDISSQGRFHATNATKRMEDIIGNDTDLIDQLESYYEEDYNFKLFGFRTLSSQIGEKT